MTRSQIAIVAAGLVLLGSIIAALTLRSQYAAISKNDMLGVVPGMTRDQVEKLIVARKWVCAAAPDGASVDCNTNAGPLTVAFANGPGPTPVDGVRVVLANTEKLSIDAMASDISAQYGRPPQRRFATEFGWTLPGGTPLVLVQEPTGDLVLSLSSAPRRPAPKR